MTKNRAKLVNATDQDLQKEQLLDMKKLIERGDLDEDHRKDTFLSNKQPARTGEDEGHAVNTPNSVFKKREVKKAGKKRKAEVSDGETDL
jgi:hypothetical protein